MIFRRSLRLVPPSRAALRLRRPHPHLHMQRSGHGLIRSHKQISSTATGIHGPSVLGLVVVQNAAQVSAQRRVPHGAGQNCFPAPHALVHRAAERSGVTRQNRVIAILSRMPEPPNPFRIEILFFKWTVMIGALRNWQKMQNVFEPMCDTWIVRGLNVRGKISALVRDVVIETADSRNDRVPPCPANPRARVCSDFPHRRVCARVRADLDGATRRPTISAPLRACSSPCRRDPCSGKWARFPPRPSNPAAWGCGVIRRAGQSIRRQARCGRESGRLPK